MTDHLLPEISLIAGANKTTESIGLSAVELLELKNRLKDELKTLEIARTTADLDAHSSDMVELKASISQLQDQLLEESDRVSLQELIIKRFEMHKLLCSVLFSQDKDDELATNSLDELPRASEIMSVQKEIEEFQKTVDVLKTENQELKYNNMAVMEDLKTRKEKLLSNIPQLSSDRNYQKLKSEIDVLSKCSDILKNIFPRLVMGAGKQDDPHLQSLVLECSELLNPTSVKE